MNELVDTLPDANVQPAEYQRLLGYPRDHPLSDRALELADRARAWYVANGKPWVYARQAECVEITNGSVHIDGASFVGRSLQAALHQAEAESVVLVAVSAGPELEREAQEMWRQEKPDEYFFLEVYGSAVVEHLVTMCGARLCAWAEPQQMAVLPHMSPGYLDWDVSQQPHLLQLIRSDGRSVLPGQLDVLPTGMLRPKKSLLAVFGVTRRTAHVRRHGELNPCEGCSFLPCQFRRAPYRRAPQFSGIAISSPSMSTTIGPQPALIPLNREAKYAVHVKALARWTNERLTLARRGNGTIDVLFRYEGTTCTNLGRRLLFDYHVRLGPADLGYPIQSLKCVPASGDEGYMSMCEYIDNSEALMTAIKGEKPLLGQPLNSVLTWESPATGAGCYCQLGDRMHKWRLVLETIHYALVEQDKRQPQSTNELAGVP